MAQRINPLTDLRETIMDLIGILKDEILTLPDEQGDLMLVEFFFKQLHPQRIMNHVHKFIVPHKEKISQRDEKFFLNNKGLFSGLPEDRVEHYGKIISHSDRLSQEDRDEIWEYFDTIIGLAELYSSTASE